MSKSVLVKFYLDNEYHDEIRIDSSITLIKLREIYNILKNRISRLVMRRMDDGSMIYFENEDISINEMLEYQNDKNKISLYVAEYMSKEKGTTEK